MSVVASAGRIDTYGVRFQLQRSTVARRGHTDRQQLADSWRYQRTKNGQLFGVKRADSHGN